MADETMQTEDETSWWDLDIFGDSELPSTSFDEPLEWPETLDWGDFSAPEGELQFPGVGDLESHPAAVPEPPAPKPAAPEPAPVADTQWRAVGEDGDRTMPHVTVLSGLGGGGRPVAAPAPRASEPTLHERLPESLWAGEAGEGVQPVVTTTMARPTSYAEPDGGAGGWKRRFDIRHGNAAIIALIAFVSLILLGMFMSVRARNQTPITSVTPTTIDQIQVQGTLNTVPLTTPANTTPAPINIADLVPPAEDATIATIGAGSGTSPATTAAPARSTPAASTATTQPAAQPTNTTAAPQTTAVPDTTTPSVTSPPANQTTTPTTPRLPTSVTPTTPTTPTTEFTMPTLPPEYGITIPPNRGR